MSVYEYSGQNRLVKGTNETGETSEYVYNAMGARIQNIQTRANVNVGYMNAVLDGGSLFIKDYMPTLSDGRNTWQRTWETEVGTTVQNNRETVTKNYVVDYLSMANRDIMVYEEGSFTQRNVYAQDGKRISTELTYAEGTQRGEPGENIASDTAVRLQKVWYRTSHLDSTLFAVDEQGEVVTHTIYDPWGNPQSETKTDLNYTGLDNRNNYTGYTWDVTLELYFAQARFYDPENHRFTQEDPIKDGDNWYGYVGNGPLGAVDPTGLAAFVSGKYIEGTIKDAPNLSNLIDSGFVRNPDKKDNPGDQFLWLAAGAGAWAFEKEQPEASAMLRHYLSRLGTTVVVDLEKAYNEDIGYKYILNLNMQGMRKTIDSLYEENPKDRYTIISESPVAVPNGQSENWRRTIGAFWCYLYGDAKISGDFIKNATMEVTIHMEDAYNFNTDGGSEVTLGIKDTVLGRLAEVGLAKGFKTNGEFKKTVTWQVGVARYEQKLECPEITPRE